MGRFDGVLLVSDYDDTFCDDNGYVPQVNIDAVEFFVANGGHFTIATGRAHTTFAPYVGRVPVNTPVILSNGSALYDFRADVMLEQTLLDRRAPADLAALCAAVEGLGFEAYHGEDIYAHAPNWVTDAHMKRVGSDYVALPIEQMPTPWTKAIVQGEHADLLRAREWLHTACPGRYETIFSNHYYLEVTDRGSNKGGMVVKLARRLDIAPEHIWCVGDNQNDIPLLELSRIPFAPSDCADEVKQWGATLLCPCGEGTIARVVDELCRHYSE